MSTLQHYKQNQNIYHSNDRIDAKIRYLAISQIRPKDYIKIYTHLTN